MSKILIKNIKGLVQAGEEIPRIRKGSAMSELDIIEDAFLALQDGEVMDYGKMSQLQGIDDWRDVEVIDAEGCFVLPAFIDSHTHSVFAKTREEEFIDRISGLSYEEIALKGGGILNSAEKLASMSEDRLFLEAKQRILKMINAGTGAIEIKSGYGLTVEAEIKMLRVIKRLKCEMPIAIKATFLGAHAYPSKYKTDKGAYIKLITEEMIPIIKEENLADYIDVFCERNYFSVEEMAKILAAGKSIGLKAKVHVNQFSILGGVKKAVELGAISVDHLEEMDEEDIESLKSSTTLPTLLPGCSHFLSIPFGDARRLISAGLPVVLASDFNPGSSPNYDLFTILSLACVKQKMTPEEAINALTINAAAALELSESHGVIAKGRKSPIVLTHEIPSLAYLAYAFGEKHVKRIFL